jgi:hypothetical protein
MNLADVLSSAEARLAVKNYMEFFTGQNCRTCNSAISGYFCQMRLNSKTYIQMEKEVKERTCKPAWHGLLYFAGNHHREDLMTDAKATEYIAKGLLLEEHFEALPEKKKYAKTKREATAPEATAPEAEATAPEAEATAPEAEATAPETTETTEN